jgi:hypothetical protein
VGENFIIRDIDHRNLGGDKGCNRVWCAHILTDAPGCL